jgi:hypothetical protein
VRGRFFTGYLVSEYWAAFNFYLRFQWLEQSRIMFLRYWGKRKAVVLAAAVKEALAVTETSQ